MPFNVISSPEAFLAVLHVGDNFWFMTSQNDIGPVDIKGPVTVTAINLKKLTVKFTTQNGRLKTEYIEDLTNPHHGVFLDEHDAKAYLIHEKLRWATDPELQAELEANRQRTLIRHLMTMDEMW